MKPETTTTEDLRHFSALLGGEPELLCAWVEGSGFRRLGLCSGVILAGAGLYGAAMGYWRAPLQALFVAVKFPLIIFLTTIGNAMLNATLAPLLGANISFRQSFFAILVSFAIASAILASFSPLAAFMIWNVPLMSPNLQTSGATYSLIQLTHVVAIAFAGVVANFRLAQMLRRLSGSVAAARRVLVAWLAGNLFLGSQLSWIFRPFIGSPGLEVEFLRQTAFQGNFYETVFRSMLRLLNSD